MIALRILGRNVALVVDHALADLILSSEGPSAGVLAWTRTAGRDGGAGLDISRGRPRFSHRNAYSSLLSAFFKEPNILLMDEDEPGHRKWRGEWEVAMENAIATLFEHALSQRDEPDHSSQRGDSPERPCWAHDNLRSIV